jgi:flagellar motor switch protein FliN/FliY
MADDTPTPDPAANPSPASDLVPEPSAVDLAALLNSTASAPVSAPDVEPAANTAAEPTADEAANLASLDHISIEELLKQASFESPAAAPAGSGLAEASPAPGAVAAPEAAEFPLQNFQQVMQDAQSSSIDLLRDVELNVKIELGRSRMLVEDVLKLSEGSVVELDKLAGDPVDVFVNDRLVARGEVLVLNDNFCVRVNEIVAGIKEEGG